MWEARDIDISYVLAARRRLSSIWFVYKSGDKNPVWLLTQGEFWELLVGLAGSAGLPFSEPRDRLDTLPPTAPFINQLPRLLIILFLRLCGQWLSRWEHCELVSGWWLCCWHIILDLSPTALMYHSIQNMYAEYTSMIYTFSQSQITPVYNILRLDKDSLVNGTYRALWWRGTLISPVTQLVIHDLLIW